MSITLTKSASSAGESRLAEELEFTLDAIHADPRDGGDGPVKTVSCAAPTYATLTNRNAGFLSRDQQDTLRHSGVFVCGVGGMGGAALQALVRAGVGRVAVADFDHFEATGLNRQVFASTENLGRAKTRATRDALLKINPELDIEMFGSEWVDHLDHVLARYPVAVNGMDDVRAGIHLYRKARERGATVIDAYTSPFPSVTVVTPRDPRPEERLGYPTVGIPVAELTEHQLRLSFMRELSYVLAATTGISKLDPVVVEEILRGRRPPSSFAPVAITAGNLMAFEAIRALLGLPSGAGHKGYLLDLWSGRVERPGRKMLMRLKRWIAGRALARAAYG